MKVKVFNCFTQAETTELENKVQSEPNEEQTDRPPVEQGKQRNKGGKGAITHALLLLPTSDFRLPHTQSPHTQLPHTQSPFLNYYDNESSLTE